jgi:hypothetical protein
MAKTLNRRKPGYTRNGEVRIVSLSVKQLTELMNKTQKNKVQAKINRRITLLKSRPGYQEPVVEAVPDETQPV